MSELFAQNRRRQFYFMLALELALGLALLVGGGDLLVRGAVALAVRSGLSPLLIGLTIVGFGTSTPELVTSVQAALAGLPGIAVGNVVGSNIANILLIFGLTAAISPIVVKRAEFLRDGTVLGLTTLAIVGLSLTGTLSRMTGLLLLTGLAAYLVTAYLMDRKSQAAAEPPAAPAMPMGLALGALAGGIALTVFGAHLLVGASVELARTWGVSETVIGLTIVAVGTSLPELVTSLVAALRKQGDIALGNVVGSNIFNVLGILGVTALVSPIQIPDEIIRIDAWIMLGATAMLGLVAATGWRASRAEGFGLLGSYGAYLGLLLWRSGL